MEIIVTSTAPAKIDFNYEAIKAELAEKLTYYNGLVVAEDNIKIAKADKAKLNALKKAISDKRIEEKKEYLKPFEMFEAKMKELTEMVDEPVRAIDIQLKGYEDKQKADKRGSIEIMYKNIVADEHKGLLPLEKIYNPRWENISYSHADINNEITEARIDLLQGLEAIEALKTEFKAQIKDKFLQTLDISIALAENKRLKEQKELLDASKKAEVKAEVKDVPNEEAPEAEEKIYILDFRVHATGKQLSDLKAFMINNNIKFGKVE